MAHIINTLLLIVFIPGLSVADANVFWAGAATVDIQLPKGVPLAGYGSPKRRNFNPFKRNRYAKWFKASKGHLDPIRAKTIYMQLGENRVFLTSIDLVGTFRKIPLAVLSRLSDIDLNESELFVSSTHTHSGPGCYAKNFVWEIITADRYNKRVFNVIIDGIEESIREAIANSEPALVGVAQSDLEGFTRNRRELDEFNNTLTLLKLQNTRGESIATAFNFAIHPTVISQKIMYLSSDVSGAIEQHLANLTDGDVLFVNGAEGDISPKAKTGDHAGAQELGKRMADKAFVTWLTTPVLHPMDLRSHSKSWNIGRARWNPLACLGNGKKSGKWLPSLKRWVSSKTLMSAFSIDNHLFMGIPGEAITRIGWSAENLASLYGYTSSSVLGLTNDYIGYIVDREQYFAGGYEACSSLHGPDLGNKVLKGLKSVIEEMK